MNLPALSRLAAGQSRAFADSMAALIHSRAALESAASDLVASTSDTDAVSSPAISRSEICPFFRSRASVAPIKDADPIAAAVCPRLLSKSALMDASCACAFSYKAREKSSISDPRAGCLDNHQITGCGGGCHGRSRCNFFPTPNGEAAE
jgi:hypothetical protein